MVEGVWSGTVLGASPQKHVGNGRVRKVICCTIVKLFNIRVTMVQHLCNKKPASIERVISIILNLIKSYLQHLLSCLIKQQLKIANAEPKNGAVR